MRMKPDQIKTVCQKVLQTLKSKGLLHAKKGDTEILHRMEEIFAADLRVEDDINDQAQKILDQYAQKMGANFDRQKMFQLIKKQLIKDKGLVI